MARLQELVEPVRKSCQNKEQRYKYRSIDQVYNAIQPLLARCRIHISNDQMEVLQRYSIERGKFKAIWRGVEIKITSIVYSGIDGSSIRHVVLAAGEDAGDKYMNKAISFGEKYSLMTLLKIPTEEFVEGDDPRHQYLEGQGNSESYGDPDDVLGGIFNDIDNATTNADLNSVMRRAAALKKQGAIDNDQFQEVNGRCEAKRKDI